MASGQQTTAGSVAPKGGKESPLIDSSRMRELLELRRRSPARGHRGWLIRRLLLLADLIGLAVAFLTAELLTGRQGGAVSEHLEYLLFLATLPAWVVGAKLYGLYDKDEERTDHSTSDEIVTFIHFVTVGSWILFVGLWLSQLAIPNPQKLALFWLVAIVLVGLGRTGARAYARRRPEYLQNAIIVGSGSVGRLLARKLRQHPEYRVNLVGFVASASEEDRAATGEVPVIGAPDQLVELAVAYGVDRVVFADPGESRGTLGLARELNELDVQVDVVPPLYDLVSPGVSIHTVGGFPLLGLPPARLSRSSRLLKRLSDIAVSGTSLLVLTSMLALIAIAIKLDTRGPIFFRQIRRGEGDCLFSLYKFRTMTADAEARKSEVAHLNIHRQEGGDPRMFKIKDDPRVTRVGRILRCYLLDELPQLYNVLKGDMSLVGPRPLILEEDRHVEAWARRRLDLKPGITGLWQVLGRQAISFEEMVKLDYVYVTTWSFGGDLRLLLRTMPLVIKGQGGSY